MSKRIQVLNFRLLTQSEITLPKRRTGLFKPRSYLKEWYYTARFEKRSQNTDFEVGAIFYTEDEHCWLVYQTDGNTVFVESLMRSPVKYEGGHEADTVIVFVSDYQEELF